MPRKVTSTTEVRSERAGFLRRLRLLGADRELVAEYDEAWDSLADRHALTRASDSALRALIRQSGPAVTEPSDGDIPVEDVPADVTSGSPTVPDGPETGSDDGETGDDLEQSWEAAGLAEHNTVSLVNEWIGDDPARARFARGVEATRDDGGRKGVQEHIASVLDER